MKTKISSTALRFLILALCGSASAAPFQNGSFEINAGYDTSSAVGWSSTAGTIRYFNDEGTTDGVWAASFNSHAVASGEVLSQTFDTVPGLSYAFAFDWGNYQSSPAQRLKIEMRDATSSNELITIGSGTANVGGGGSGAIIEQNTNVFIISDSTGAIATNAPAPNVEFGTFGFTFIAQSPSSILSFTDQATGNTANSDGLLDNVRIVPEPGSLALVVMGLFPLALRRRRRLNG